MISIPKKADRIIWPSSKKLDFEDNEYLAVFTRGDKQVVYKSKNKVVCLGEFAIDNLNIDSNYWVLIYELSKGYYYAAVVDKNVVISEELGTLDEVKMIVNYDIENADFVATNRSLKLKSEMKIEDIPLDSISDIYFTSLAPALERQKKKRTLRTVAIGFAVAVTILVTAFSYEPKKTVITKNIDIYDNYKSDISQQIDAHHALNQAAILFSKSLLFPDGMELDSIEKEGQSLVMKFNHEKVKKTVFYQWLELNPQMKKILRDNQFKLDLKGSSDKWLTHIIPFNELPEFVHDYTLDLGAKEVKIDDLVTNKNYIQKSMNVRFTSDEFAKLSLLSKVLKNKPSFLTSLKIIPVKKATGLSNINLSLTFKGKNNE